MDHEMQEKNYFELISVAHSKSLYFIFPITAGNRKEFSFFLSFKSWEKVEMLGIATEKEGGLNETLGFHSMAVAGEAVGVKVFLM